MKNYKKICKRVAAGALVMCMAFATGCSSKSESKENKVKSAPDGKYSELVTYTLGKNTPTSPRLPEGDTYENNAYTRYLKEKYNIQNKNMFEAPNGEAYNQQISMAIVSGEIPDIMVVHDYNQLKQLVDNDLIADLTEVFEQYASPAIKDKYKSYDGKALEGATFDGKLMAIPGTRTDSKPNLFWLRKDWMDKLNLKAPKSLDDLEYILQQFVEKDPGGNGSGKTVGLICNTWLEDIDFLFASQGGFRDKWLKDKDGNIVNSSITPEMKKGLGKAAEWYKKGLIDKEFATRTYDDNIAMVVNGQCGAFYGWWFSPDYPFTDAKKIDPNMQWEPYLIPLKEGDKINIVTENPSDKYLVARKEFKHPEIAVNMINALFADIDQDAVNKKPIVNEIMEYRKQNVDGGVSPLDMIVDYKDSIYRMYSNINAALNNEKDPNTLAAEDFSRYQNIVKYFENIKNTKTPEVSEWASYYSRIVGAKMSGEAMRSKENLNITEPVFFGQTPSMKLKNATLSKMQEETYLKIITGEKPIDAFDQFVEDWKKAGGEQITNEVKKEIGQ